MVTTATILACALCLDAALGEPAWLWSRLRHPAVLMGAAVAWCDRRLNHPPGQRLKGCVALGLLVALALALGFALSLLGPVAEAVIAAILLAQKSLVDHVRAVAKGLRLSVPDGRRAVALIVSRNTADMHAPQIARAAIESASENLSDAVIAPAFWFLIGGLPGILVYKFVNTADSMIGYRTDTYAAFGWAAARFDDLINLIPARLTCLIVLVAGAVSPRALSSVIRDAHQHRSPNAGWPEAAMARALGIALAGPRSYDGRLQDFAWVNPAGRKDIGAAEIDRAITVLWRSWILAVGGTIMIAAWGAVA